MARFRSSHYVKVDEDILRDPDVMELIDEGGYEAFGIYIALLTVIRSFEATDYMIPDTKLRLIANKILNLYAVRLKSNIDLMIKCHLLSVEEIDGVRYYYSPRRKKELLEQNEVRKKQSEGAKTTNRKRYGQ